MAEYNHPSDAQGRGGPDDRRAGDRSGDPLGDHGGGDVDHVDLLITRITDGQAADEDRAQFEQLASMSPDLWQRLADAQQQAQLLAGSVDRTLASALNIDLPAPSQVDAEDLVARLNQQQARSPWRSAASSFAWLSAFSGWAAVVVIAVVWSLQSNTPVSTPGGTRASDQSSTDQLSSHDFLNRYRSSPGVSEWPFYVMDTVPTEDGGRKLTIMLRFVEDFTLSPDQVPNFDKLVESGEDAMTVDNFERILDRHPPIDRATDDDGNSSQ